MVLHSNEFQKVEQSFHTIDPLAISHNAPGLEASMQDIFERLNCKILHNCIEDPGYWSNQDALRDMCHKGLLILLSD